jgi:hypothetical protein
MDNINYINGTYTVINQLSLQKETQHKKWLRI